MENSNSKHHLTAGGFVFYKDQRTDEICVVLIKNKWGQWWIPKGHIENGENPLQTAVREIKEETGLDRKNIKLAGFCSKDSFIFEKDGRSDTKDLYIYAFNSIKKMGLVKPEDDNLHDVAWFKYKDALEIIKFNRDDLIKAKDIFDKAYKDILTKQISIESTLKNKSNDYLSLESEFNKKYKIDLLSHSPLGDNFIFSQKVSVIIPSYNSGDALLGTLNTLNNQILSDSEFDLLEVIIIDDGSTDGTEDKVKQGEYKFSLKYSKQENLGRSAARNKGIALSSGEIIIFLDSDVFLEKHLIREHAFRTEMMKQSVFISFRENVCMNTQEVLHLLSDGIKPNIRKDFRFEKFVSPDWKRVHRTGQKIDTRVVKLVEETNNFKDFGYGKILGVWDLPSTALTCSISMRKSDLLNIGGFSLEFKGWGMEDTFLGACMIASGNFIIPIFSTGIYHIKHSERSGNQETQLQEFNNNVETYNKLIKNNLEELY